MFAWFQFSLRDLLAVVAFVAVGITALVSANGWWEGCLWGGVLFALALALLFLFYGRGAGRAFWLGFAVFGWLYLAVFLTSQLPGQLQTWIRTDAMQFDHLIVTRLAVWGYFKLLPASRTSQWIPNSTTPGDSMGGGMPSAGYIGPGGSGGGMMGGPPAMANPNYVPMEDFVQISHALFLLMIAAVGGKAAQVIYRAQRPPE